METQPQIGTIVALLPGCEGMYDVAKPGWRALVKDTKTDEDGFALIYVSWDTENWRWQPGQADGWTYPAHFKVVGQTHMKDMIAVAQERVAKETAAEAGGCPHCGSNHDDESPDVSRENYQDVLTDAAGAAMDAEGFVMVWVAKEPIAEDSYALQSNMVVYGLTDAATDALEIQMLSLANNTLTGLIGERIARYEP